MTKLKLVLLHVLTIVQILAPVLSRASSSSGLVSHLGDDDDDIIIDLSGYGDALFRKPDFETTNKRLAAYNPNTSLCNPEELGTYFQGDILFSNTRSLKSGLRNTRYRWIRAVVPYVIEDSFKDEEVAKILNAFEEYHKKTCVRFEKRTNERDYVSIRKAGLCYSDVGRKRGGQIVSLGSQFCLNHGSILHELMHAIGFLHEQSRHDRDNYIKVLWENISQDSRHNFKISTPSYSDSFGVEYDYYSVMHYSLHAGSRNGQKTMQPLKPGIDEKKIGLHESLTESDVQRINAMYKCR